MADTSCKVGKIGGELLSRELALYVERKGHLERADDLVDFEKHCRRKLQYSHYMNLLLLSRRTRSTEI